MTKKYAFTEDELFKMSRQTRRLIRKRRIESARSMRNRLKHAQRRRNQRPTR